MSREKVKPTTLKKLIENYGETREESENKTIAII